MPNAFPLVLIVDGQPDLLTTTIAALRKVHTVVVATQGIDGIRRTAATPTPALILLSINLPDMDGFEFMRQIQNQPPLQNIPIILMSSAANSTEEEYGLALGAVDYVVRSISIPALLSRVRNQLAVHESRDRLQQYLEVEQKKLKKLVDIAKNLAMERDMDALLKAILYGGKELAHADKATLYLRTEDHFLRFAYLSSDDELPSRLLPLYDPESGDEVHRYVSTHVALTGEPVLLADVYGDVGPFDVSGTLSYDQATGYRTRSMLTVALKPREGVPLGVLQLINPMDPKTGDVIALDSEWIGFVEALATQGAIALDSLNLMRAQEKLFEAIIRVMATAIDAKSPYTAGHCERVPMLGSMLVEAACQADSGPLAHFAMTADEQKEFHLACWMHDCGKVTTPEAVVDKATKLECVHNRIHEIRMRFEVLWREAQIDHLERRLAGIDVTQDALTAQLDSLRQDFAFVARTNVGDQVTSAADVARIQHIAARQWQRYFDDRLGLSHMEEARLADPAPLTWPVREPLLADRPEHRQPRTDTRLSYDANAMGITLAIPENASNFGEIYNLCIPRGTLNAEERFKINEHVIHTLAMLRQLPFPKGMANVPELAGAHHETMLGTGYPRGLRRDEMNVQARVLAIADIFEALTAVDRPYKKAKTLSEALKIMSFMCKDGHIDQDLFALFLRSGVYRRYAESNLRPEQIDAVDEEAILKKL
ncbi:MAG: response regulator [Magnetococcales bacterium]|nr:response regulator [Magnetococcales bacterium]